MASVNAAAHFMRNALTPARPSYILRKRSLWGTISSLEEISYDAIRPDLLDELPVDYEKPEDLLGNGGLIKQVKTALVAR